MGWSCARIAAAVTGWAGLHAHMEYAVTRACYRAPFSGDGLNLNLPFVVCLRARRASIKDALKALSRTPFIPPPQVAS